MYENLTYTFFEDKSTLKSKIFFQIVFLFTVFLIFNPALVESKISFVKSQHLTKYNSHMFAKYKYFSPSSILSSINLNLHALLKTWFENYFVFFHTLFSIQTLIRNHQTKSIIIKKMPKIKQKDIQKQKLIQDQHFSNSIFYGMLSTLESIIGYKQGHPSDFTNKIFTKYDHIDYRSKNYMELKMQLQTSILIFRASKSIFKMQNKDDEWELPKNFDKTKSIYFIKNAMDILRQRNDQASFNLAFDILEILEDRCENLYVDSVDLNVSYSQSQKKQFRSNLFKNGLFATDQMNKKGEEAKKYQDPSELPANIEDTNSPLVKTNDQVYKRSLQKEEIKKQTAGSDQNSQAKGVNKAQNYDSQGKGVQNVQNFQGKGVKETTKG